MHYVFGSYVLRPDRAELIGAEGEVRLEPKAYAVLRHLVEHHDRVVSREELIEIAWGGRFVSDAAVATALKAARRAVGDDGVRQDMIRTLHGAGHRFVARVERRVDATTVVQHDESAPDQQGQRPTIAVLPIVQSASEAVQIGDGLSDEIISSLSRLRWLRVIARESSFRFRQDGIDLVAMRRVLGAGYVLSGRVETSGARLALSVTLIDTANGAVIWADRFAHALDDLHTARQEVVEAVVGALDLQIPQAEAMAARGKPTEALDAWGAYHLGMSHLHRFNAHDNTIALGLFEQATRLDPAFATAFAARSFAKLQEVAQAYSTDHARIIAETRRLAERAVELDPFDPFANMVMGRTSLLSDGPDEGRVWYDRATNLSPSFAKGHYSRGIIDMLAGRTGEARDRLDRAMGLSPMDPLLGIMLTAKALSFMVEGRMDLAQEWALRSVGVNQTHFLVLTSAALACQLAGDGAGARRWTLHLRTLRPEATITPYLKTLHFADEGLRMRVRDTLLGLGMAE